MKCIHTVFCDTFITTNFYLLGFERKYDLSDERLGLKVLLLVKTGEGDDRIWKDA